MSPRPLGCSLVCVEKFHLWDPAEMGDRVAQGAQTEMLSMEPHTGRRDKEWKHGALKVSVGILSFQRFIADVAESTA